MLIRFSECWGVYAPELSLRCAGPSECYEAMKSDDDDDDDDGDAV